MGNKLFPIKASYNQGYDSKGIYVYTAGTIATVKVCKYSMVQPQVQRNSHASCSCVCSQLQLHAHGVHSVQCNVNLAATCKGLQLTLVSAWSACSIAACILNLWLHGTVN